jgi:hypothetical protein
MPKAAFVDVQTGTKIFTVKGIAEFGRLQGNRLVYSLAGAPNAYDLDCNVSLWHSDVPSFGPAVLFGGRWIALSADTGNVDGNTGKAVQRLADVKVGYYDFMPARFMSGYLVPDNGKLYIGSSNGFFGCVSKLP